MKNFHPYLILSTFILASCGGGGGGGGGSTPTTPTTPAPTVNLSAEPTSVLLESTSTLTWSSSNATSCSASWTSQTSTSGSEAITISTAGNNSFSISCTGDGGTRSASVAVEGYRETDGVVVDGYISGAEVCIDEDESWTCDSNENRTTSDNEGKFTIRYANGNLVSIGGTDLDSQTLLDNLLITHKLTGHSDFKAVTPVTSIAAFMEDASLVNAALGIDSSIDVFAFDPVANKGDDGIYDFLYEKGNQLTVLAFALQNITNNLNTTTETTQDYFKAITEEIEKKYTETETKVDIETEAFITNVVDNVIAAKSVTINETAKANTTKALAGVMPVIEVKSFDDLTTSVIRFAVSTLQTDIQDIANGTATAETVIAYTSNVLAYIAEDQNIDSSAITPSIIAIPDNATTAEDTSVTINVLLNDSYLTSAPISVSAEDGANGTIALAESSSEQIVYTPNADYNGTDTFTYTITQGDKTSSADVTVTIEAVNDAPSIDITSTILVAENQTAVTTVSVSDVDEDDLTLTLSGTDADSFDLSTDNVLTFKEAPDFETKSSYSISLSLIDGIETVAKELIIDIKNINDNPPEIIKTNFEILENRLKIASVEVSDADGIDFSNFTYSLSTDISSNIFYDDSSSISISDLGFLSFKEEARPDFETRKDDDQDGIYEVILTVSDGIYETSNVININIIDVFNEESLRLGLTSKSGYVGFSRFSLKNEGNDTSNNSVVRGLADIGNNGSTHPFMLEYEKKNDWVISYWFKSTQDEFQNLINPDFPDIYTMPIDFRSRVSFYSKGYIPSGSSNTTNGDDALINHYYDDKTNQLKFTIKQVPKDTAVDDNYNHDFIFTSSSTNNPLNLGEWNHVVITCKADSILSSYACKFYVNGIDVSSNDNIFENNSNVTKFQFGTFKNMRIGGIGYFDQIVSWRDRSGQNLSISSSQIQDLYESKNSDLSLYEVYSNVPATYHRLDIIDSSIPDSDPNDANLLWQDIYNNLIYKYDDRFEDSYMYYNGDGHLIFEEDFIYNYEID
jgi:hypothetical protein